MKATLAALALLPLAAQAQTHEDVFRDISEDPGDGSTNWDTKVCLLTGSDGSTGGIVSFVTRDHDDCDACASGVEAILVADDDGTNVILRFVDGACADTVTRAGCTNLLDGQWTSGWGGNSQTSGKAVEYTCSGGATINIGNNYYLGTGVGQNKADVRLTSESMWWDNGPFAPDACGVDCSGVADVLGCTDATYQEYNADATADDGSCATLVDVCATADATAYQAGGCCAC
tara:strand:- start:4059 stop:4751 length:693 start_codon:yes stop_codon:yes gene_type:complete